MQPCQVKAKQNIKENFQTGTVGSCTEEAGSWELSGVLKARLASTASSRTAWASKWLSQNANKQINKCTYFLD